MTTGCRVYGQHLYMWVLRTRTRKETGNVHSSVRGWNSKSYYSAKWIGLQHSLNNNSINDTIQYTKLKCTGLVRPERVWLMTVVGFKAAVNAEQ